MHWLYANGHLCHAPLVYLSRLLTDYQHHSPANERLLHNQKGGNFVGSAYTYQPVIFELMGMHHAVYVCMCMFTLFHTTKKRSNTKNRPTINVLLVLIAVNSKIQQTKAISYNWSHLIATSMRVRQSIT